MKLDRSLICVILYLIPIVASAQDDEFKPGLLGQYRWNAETVERVDPDLAFNWGTRSPHPLVPAKDWTAEWSGQILVRSLTPYRFYFQGQGTVVIEIDGDIVLDSQTETSTWVAGNAAQVSPGFRDIVVRYQPGIAGAEMKLFWSSDEFAIEPIPGHQLFHEQDDTQIQLAEFGRQLFDSRRCANCHHAPGEIEEIDPAPALWGVTSGTNNDWIIAKLMGTHPEAKSDRMPRFGFTEEQATDVLAYLHRLEAPFDLMTSPQPKPKKNDPSGPELFNSLGCLACHQVNDLGGQGPFAGSPLTHIGNKRSADWIATWLAVPDRLNPQHRMPIFQLSRTERGLLSDYLSSLGKQEETKFGRSDRNYSSQSSDRGQALIKEYQCANCHKIPAIEAAVQPSKVLVKAPENWETSCLGDRAKLKKTQPDYPHLDRKAISAYLDRLEGKPVHQLSEFEQGQRVLERRQCLACHARGTESGLKAIAKAITKVTPSLQGQSQVVIPPNLNAVGDKLQDEVLNVALTGKQDRARANWLTVRMPMFQHSNEDLEALKYYLIEHDRIPSPGAQSHPELTLTESELLLTGRKLVGAGGWSCIACHQIGDYVPKNTAIGTRGSDLMSIGNRLRPEFYYRWTRSPIRVVPGMEMPSFTKPVAGVLDNNVHEQLAAVWSAVNDPRFEAPTNPSQVEQLLQVAENEPPRIVRDVFTVEPADGSESVARAFAIGFANQHGLLLDLDSMSLRDWRYGDFARQRTVGKSWYWDLAGASIVGELKSRSDFVMINLDDDSVEELVGTDADRLAHLLSYETTGSGAVELRYELHLKQDRDFIVSVTERFEAVVSDGQTGWRRVIRARGLPAGFTLGLRAYQSSEVSFSATIQSPETNGSQVELLNGKSAVRLVRAGNGVAALTVAYLATCVAPQVAFPEPKVISAPTDLVTTWPGYQGERLRLPASIMPTAISQDGQGRLLVTSLKGDLIRIDNLDARMGELKFEVLAEGLSAPFGVLADGQDVLVTHKPELLRLSDPDGDGSFNVREVVADGWGHSDNYHDWVTGPVFDDQGGLLVATGSDYAQPKRDRALIKWRGSIVRAATDGSVSAFANELRYPIGIASDSQGRVFVSDQQGVQNTFNEINHIVQGGSYGVPGQADGAGSKEPRLPAIQIPHPWTRSVNGIFFLPESINSPFAGHGVGCEYNGKFLIRFSMQEIAGQLQGACYPLTKPTWENETNTFLGPISGFANSKGEIFIGSIYDSGWLGGPNVGEVVRLQPTGDSGNGIREIRAIPGGFEIEFLDAVDSKKAIDPTVYSISGYTRIWQGSYASEDSGRYAPEIDDIQISDDRKTVTLKMPGLKSTFVYEFNVGDLGVDGESLFPAFGAYSLNHLPQEN